MEKIFQLVKDEISYRYIKNLLWLFFILFATIMTLVSGKQTNIISFKIMVILFSFPISITSWTSYLKEKRVEMLSIIPLSKWDIWLSRQLNVFCYWLPGLIIITMVAFLAEKGSFLFQINSLLYINLILMLDLTGYYMPMDLRFTGDNKYFVNIISMAYYSFSLATMFHFLIVFANGEPINIFAGIINIKSDSEVMLFLLLALHLTVVLLNYYCYKVFKKRRSYLEQTTPTY